MRSSWVSVVISFFIVSGVAQGYRVTAAEKPSQSESSNQSSIIYSVASQIVNAVRP
jgi:hypothetical protein